MQRVLVTTALEGSWPDEEPVLFLGEWCRRFSRRDHWSNLDHEVLTYHWDDPSLFAEDFQYVSRLYERILVDLAWTLNRLLLVDHGIRYWRILIGPWLRQFIEILCDRWRSIECVVNRAEVSYTIVLDGSQSVGVPMDIVGFHRLYNSEEWNHGVYAAILKRFPQVERRYKYGETSATSAPLPAPLHLSWKREPKVAALAAWSRAAARRVGDNGVVLVAPYMSWSDELAVHLRFRQVPLIWSFVPQVTPTMEPGTRDWSLSGHPTDPFDQFVREMIPVHMPVAYSDGYPELVATVDESPWPKKPRLIFTSNAHIGNDLFKAWAARCVEDDSQLVVGQHGGQYGNLKFFSTEDNIIEAGLGFAVKTQKPKSKFGDFIGKNAVEIKKQEGVEKRLMQFVLNDPEPLLYHNEPIIKDDRIVGYLTSGNFGHHLGSSVGMGYVDCKQKGESPEEHLKGNYMIDVAGKRYSATAYLKPAYDPLSNNVKI